MVRAIGALAGTLATVLLVGCGSMSPYLFLQDVDLERSRVFTSNEVRFDREHWICAVFDRADFARLTPADLNELQKVRYSVQPAAGVALFPFDEVARGSNDLPDRTQYLFEVSGQANARVTIDFSGVKLPVTKFRVGALKNRAQLKDPRIRWDVKPGDK